MSASQARIAAPRRFQVRTLHRCNRPPSRQDVRQALLASKTHERPNAGDENGPPAHPHLRRLYPALAPRRALHGNNWLSRTIKPCRLLRCCPLGVLGRVRQVLLAGGRDSDGLDQVVITWSFARGGGHVCAEATPPLYVPLEHDWAWWHTPGYFVRVDRWVRDSFPQHLIDSGVHPRGSPHGRQSMPTIAAGRDGYQSAIRPERSLFHPSSYRAGRWSLR